MALFRARLATGTGEIVERDYSAADAGALRRDLERQDMLVLAISRRSSFLTAAQSMFQRRGKIRMDEFLLFNQEFVALVRAGLPIVECLSMLLERRKNPAFKAALIDVRDRIRSGESLSDAFAAQELVPALYSSTLASGERSGEIPTVLTRYITYSRTILTTRNKVMAALTYPAILIGMAAVLVSVLMLYVLPQFESFFEGMGQELPMLTIIVMSTSQGMRDYAIIWAPSLLLLLGALWVWKRTPSGKSGFEALTYRLPVVGSIAKKFVITRFARTLGTLIAGGIPLVTALEIVSRAIGTPIFTAAIAKVAGKIREGAALWSSLDETKLFPDMLVEMVKVGESTGGVAEMLDHVANFVDEEIENELQSLVALIEPALLISMAIFVGLLLFAVYYPLIRLVGQMGQS